MRKLNLIRLLILSCILFSCQLKKEKKQPIIYNNTQNYKYDDEELIRKNTKDTKDKKRNLETKKVMEFSKN